MSRENEKQKNCLRWKANWIARVPTRMLGAGLGQAGRPIASTLRSLKTRMSAKNAGPTRMNEAADEMKS